MAKKSHRGNNRSQKLQGEPKATQKVQKDQINDNTQTLSESEEQQLLKRAYEMAPEWKISIIAKRKFLSLPRTLQTGAGKEACVNDTLATHRNLIPDTTRYWLWMEDEAKKLIRVWDFEETCKEAGVDPITVAEHLILEGKMVCNAVKMEGLAAYGSKIRMFVEPLFKDELHFFHKNSEGNDNE